MTEASDTVLITGGAGYIGSHVVHALRDRGQPCVVIDDLSNGHRNLVPVDVAFVQGNVGDCSTLRSIFERFPIGAVVHLAGSIFVSESAKRPLAYYKNNTTASQALLSACQDAKIRRFVFSSTAAVYGETASTLIKESDHRHPINPYGRSKLAVEWMLEDAATAGDIDYIALRFFNVAGADARLRTGEWRVQASHLINVACEAALGLRDVITIHGTDYPTADGTCVRDFIHVSDLAAAHLAALDRLAAGGGSAAINCGDGTGTSVQQVLDAVRRVSGAEIAAVHGPRRAGDPPRLVADPSLAYAQLGWRPELTIEDMISSALRWERKRRGLTQ